MHQPKAPREARRREATERPRRRGLGRVITPHCGGLGHAPEHFGNFTFYIKFYTQICINFGVFFRVVCLFLGAKKYSRPSIFPTPLLSHQIKASDGGIKQNCWD